MKPETRVMRVVQPENGGPRKRNILEAIATRYGGGKATVDRLIKSGALVKFGSTKRATWGPPRQRGFGLIELGIALAIVATVTALAFAVRSWVVDYNEGLREEGRKEVREAYQKRDNEQLRAVMAERDRLLKEKEATEARHRAALAQKEADHAKKQAQRDADYDSFLADLAAGRVVFRQPGQAGSCPSGGDPGGAGPAAADPGGGNGPVGGRGLRGQDEDALFLLAEARRANRAVEKLNLCRSVLEEERR